MKRTINSFVVLLALLATTSLAWGQDKQQEQHGFVDFGARSVWGNVYGRPDLPFQPSLRYSKLNEYRDVRDGFFIRSAYLDFENFLGTGNYLTFQTQKAIYRDQGYLATFGNWGKFKVQLRYDQIPHVYSSTARTILAQTAPGRWTVPTLARTALFNLSTSNVGCATQTTFGCNLPSAIQTQLVPQSQFYIPQIDRRAGSLGFAYNLTAENSVFASFRREHQSGTRPIGFLFNSSPSAAIGGGFGLEVPESIDYFFNNVRVGTELGGKRWGARVAYLGSFVDNRIPTLTVDNPFRTTDCVAPTSNAPATCNSSTQGPAMGQMDLYPSNSAHNIDLSGAFDLARNTRLMASIVPGWERQNDPFLPYTANTVRLAQTTALPETSLHGDVQTLAMNYTLSTRLSKNFEVTARYRHFDYNNNTPVEAFTPVQGDMAAPAAATENSPISFFRKNFEVMGNWYFGKKSSARVGYQGEWFDRENRDVRHSMENGVLASIDLKPRKWMGFSASYRYSVRNPEAYEDDTSTEISGGITAEQVNHRRFDEAARTRNRVDASLSLEPTDRTSFTVFAGSTQDNYNRAGGVNSSTPLNFVQGNFVPYYAYGLLKDLSWLYGADANFTLTNEVSFFAEYSFERYHKAMVSRYRAPLSSAPDGTLVPSNCGVNTAPCDSANNDWASSARDIVNSFTVGFDLNPTKKASISSYYSLSAGKTNVNSFPIGNATLTAAGATNPDRFLLTGTNAAVPYPEVTSRNHELGVVFKYKLSNRFQPKFEYRLQQWDNKDYQTSAMTPFMGCVSGIPPAAAIPGCETPVLTTNTAFPSAVASPYYPYFVVGDPSANRFLFLGVDQPSYRAHYIAATLEIHF